MFSVSYSNFRKNLKSFMTKAKDDSIPIFIKSKQGNFVLITKENYDSMDETQYLLSNPVNKKHLEESLKNMEKGEYTEFNSIEDLENALKD